MKAFPSLEWISSDGKKSGEGMDLRDYFAAQAMQVIKCSDYKNYKTTAEFCYLLADAMMKAREQLNQAQDKPILKGKRSV